MLLAVDPGIRGCGCALFKNGVLVDAAYIVNRVKTGNKADEAVEMALNVANHFVGDVSELVVEWPQIYATRIRRGETKEDPNNLLALCGVDAALAALLAVQTTSVSPAEWKGQMKKEACHLRIETRLSDAEQKIVDAAAREAGALAHNMLDAVGIGLFRLGRFDKKRVIPT